jgi:hypothetical protein
VQDARNERLVWHAFLERFDLNIAEVARRQADVDAAIFDGGSARCRLDLR